MPIIRKRLSASEFSNPALRYDEACDCVQFSPDGGVTWVDQPTNDPRRSDAYRLPPLTGDETQCRAAEGMTAYIRSVVDQSLDAEGYVELAGLIIGFAVFIPGFPVLWAIILAVAFAIFSLGSAAIEAAMTEAIYDQIRCIFYCNIDSEGQMSEDGYDSAYADLIDLPTIPRTIVQKCMEMIGYVGMSNAGVALEAAADCECECEWCYTWDFTLSDGGFTPSLGDYGIYYPGEGWRQTPDQGLIITKAFGATATITEIIYTGQSSDGSGYTWAAQLRLGGSVVFSQANPGSGIAYSTDFDPDHIDADLVLLNPFAGSTSSQLITSCTLKGVNENPIGTDNC